MIAILVLVRRAQGTTKEQFTHYWRFKHADLTKTVPDFWRHVIKYVQYHPLPADPRPESFQSGTFDYDGIGQMWFEDIDRMLETFRHPGYLEII